MKKLNELDDKKPSVGSYEAMKPWSNKVDPLILELERSEKEGRIPPHIPEDEYPG